MSSRNFLRTFAARLWGGAKDCPVTGAKLPLVIFSHGRGLLLTDPPFAVDDVVRP
ncbi:hypothetical protein [Bradyrhizobium guangzhouense]|uniref:hypothetical protein n=1 Tax=Bradyrhizobium guangzhouense TaxID=1325095 RepID=UPI0013E8B63E|nr:hypothetical protein [Bradyrhizobium guangzhouense]